MSDLFPWRDMTLLTGTSTCGTRKMGKGGGGRAHPFPFWGGCPPPALPPLATQSCPGTCFWGQCLLFPACSCLLQPGTRVTWWVWGCLGSGVSGVRKERRIETWVAESESLVGHPGGHPCTPGKGWAVGSLRFGSLISGAGRYQPGWLATPSNQKKPGTTKVRFFQKENREQLWLCPGTAGESSTC